MKFVANVEVNHRLAASFSMPKRRSQRSTLSFGTKPGKPEELILIHQSNQNVGTVYKVKNNIERVFDKYANEGKTTIRFKDPPHDLIISCETQSLERFLRALKMALRGSVPAKVLMLPPVSSDSSRKIPPKPKQHLTYLSKTDYPVQEGFPKSAVSIVINGLQKRRFDMRLLGLPHLKVLDLSDNQLSTVPPEVDLLPALKVLTLSHNRLGMGAPSAWAWLHGERLARQLQELDLSNNGLSFLPPAVCRLRALHTLKVKQNHLKALPGAIGTLPALKTLMAPDNRLDCLPGSARLLRLWILDVSNNPFVFGLQGLVPTQCQVPSLLEWAARHTINNRLHFGNEDLPLEVQGYLDTVSFCQCGRACFEAGSCAYSEVSMSAITENVVRTLGDITDVPIQLRLCSHRCVTVFNNSRE